MRKTKKHEHWADAIRFIYRPRDGNYVTTITVEDALFAILEYLECDIGKDRSVFLMPRNRGEQ